MKQPPIMETRIIPPAPWRRKFLFYSSRYGVFHTCFKLVGRMCSFFWRQFGFLATRKYMRQYLEAENDIILNLGGGSNINERYLTADIDPRADIYTDITRPLPFPSSSVTHILLEEVIEHVTYIQASALLAECHRIMKPGGCIRIITPDLAHFANAVLERNDADKINAVFYEHGHKYIYTRDKLKALVLAADYSEPCFTAYLDPDSKLGHLDSHPYRFNHAPEISQYLEAFKQ